MFLFTRWIFLNKVPHGIISGGDPFYSLGFKIGPITYLSDASSIPRNLDIYLEHSDILILDALKCKPTLLFFSQFLFIFPNIYIVVYIYILILYLSIYQSSFFFFHLFY